jgi:hypothetical protein
MLDLERDVLHPLRRVVIAIHLWPRRQFEEREHVAHAAIEEHVHVRVGLLGRRDLVFSECNREVHVQDPLIEFDRFPGIFAAIRDVVNTFEIHALLLSGARVNNATGNLVTFDRFE